MTEDEPVCQRDGPDLFQKVKDWLADHWIFDEPLDRSIVALFIFQTRCYRLLPSVFYLFVMGKAGSGKSKLLITLSRLGRGLNLGDITAASMARELGRGREARADAHQRVGRSTFPVQYHCATVDELDKLGKDQRAECEGILRNGYTWDGAMFTRCVGEKMTVKQWDIYMPKAMAGTSDMELALGTRGFRISAADKEGDDAYNIMLNNRWVHGADELVAELDQFANALNKSYSWEDIEAMERSDQHKDLVKKVMGNLGATRNSEHIATCVTISQLIGVDITEELKHGLETILLSSEEFEEEVAEINAAIDALTKDVKTGKMVTIKQSAIKAKINEARTLAGQRTIGNTRFKEAYRQAGIRDSMIRSRHNCNYWVLPIEKIALIRTLANLPNLPNLDDELGQQTLEVSKVSKVSMTEQVALLHKDFEKGVPYDALVEKYGLGLVEREKIPKVGGR
jgi:hypothetical protein